jgi:hypothetical protein
VQDEVTSRGTSTSDSGRGARLITVGPWFPPGRAEIVLQHKAGPCWCSAGGEWVTQRERAVKFATNLDALVYCQALGVDGVVVAFDQFGGKMYELNVDRILDAVSADPDIRAIMARRRQNGWNPCPNSAGNQ